MRNLRPTPTDPAYQRLTSRDARKGIRAACLLASAFAGGWLIAHIAVGASPTGTAFCVFVALSFIVAFVLTGRCPRSWLDPIAGITAALAIAATIGSVTPAPLLSASLTVGIIGLVPITAALFLLWDLRTHVTWLVLTTVMVVLMVAWARDDPAMEDSVVAILLGWFIGCIVSLVAQQAVTRGRGALYLAVTQAHASRAKGARTLRQLHAVEAIGHALSDHGPTDETLDAAMRLLRDEFGYAFPSIYLGDDKGIRLRAHLGHEHPVVELDRTRGVIGRVMRTRQSSLVLDVRRDPDYLDVGANASSEIVVPLLAGDRFLGVVNIESSFTLGPDDLASISIVADRFAAAISLAERRDALQTVLDESPLPTAAFGPDGLVTYWNPAATDLFGWTADEVVGGRVPILDERDPTSHAITASVGHGERIVGAEVERLHRDGHLVPVRVFAAPFGDRPPYGMISIYQDLAPERAATSALVESEARFEAVIGALREGVLVQDLDHNILWANSAAERLLGRDLDQLLGRTPWEPGWTVIDEDEMPVLPEAYLGGASFQTGQPVLGTVLGVRRPDGGVTWLEADALPLCRAPEEPPYAVVTTFNDVTERKRHEDELELAERRVRSVLEQASNPIIGVDREGIITFANARVEEVFGYGAGELAGRPVEVLVPDHLIVAHLEHRGRFMAHPASRPMGIGMELQGRHRDGSLVPVEIAISPVETPTGLEVYATIIDTTERRRIEAELLQAAKMDSIGRLAGGIAHDFNNLLTAILGYGRIAVAELSPDEPARADVGEIVVAAERAADLTRQLLGFARKTALTPATHDLNVIVSALEPFLRRLLGERVALVTGLGAETGHIRVDRAQIDQILVNLALNARDAMPDGGTLIIETTALDGDDVDGLLGLTGDRIAMLAVSDTGFGMSEEVRARVFEPFFTTKPFGEGTGLGLATTYGIVNQSGGAITVDSEPGAGTTFRIYFPQVPATLPEAPEERTVLPATSGSRTILVVEDEESVRTLVSRMLELMGYRVLQAPNGEAALSLVGTRLGELDLLLTDVVMPGMRGPELYQVLRSARPDLPVVFMSGYAAAEESDDAIPPSALLLTKPFSMDALEAAVAERMPARVGD